MENSVSIDVLEERLDGLREWLDERFHRLNDQYQHFCELRSADRSRLAELEQKYEEHEERLQQLERISWLIVGAAGFLSPVVIWAIIEIIKVLVR